jgi:hypothetical protein
MLKSKFGFDQLEIDSENSTVMSFWDASLNK